MKRIIKVIAYFSFWLVWNQFFTPCFADFDKATLDEHFSSSKLTDHGVIFVRLQDRATLYEKNADTLLSPASVTKLLTSATVLANFGPSQSFKTPLFYTGNLKSGKLSGNLYVQGSGDPFLVSEVMWQAFTDLKHLGIHSIEGDLFIDQSLFDGETRDDSRQEGEKRSSHAYDAPVSAFAINFNTYAIAIAPGDAPRTKARVMTSPFPLSLVDTTSSAVTTVGQGDLVSASRKSQKNGRDLLTVSGEIGINAPMKKLYRSVGTPDQAAFDYLRGFLKEAGISLKGKNRLGVVPPNAKHLYDIQGFEVRRMVSGLNTFSNNFIADMLTKKLGASFASPEAADRPGSGTLTRGVEVIQKFLRSDVGIKSNFQLLNGSGLSTENRLTARQILEVLVHMENQGDLFPDFLASLPASGLDGTLKKRMTKNQDLLGLIRAKTGTLTEPVTVASIAGYFRHPKHGWVAFCMMANGRNGQGQPGLSQVRKIQDDIFRLTL